MDSDAHVDPPGTRSVVGSWAGGGGHVEHLRVPWWVWVVAAAVAAGFAAEVHLGYDGVRAWVPYTVVLPPVLAAVWWLGRIRVAVSGGMFRVDDAAVPLAVLAAAEALTGEAKRDALARDLDPVAFVVHRPWVRAAVRVYLDDPADPTPYWIVSTRRPDALLAALDLPVPAPEDDPPPP